VLLHERRAGYAIFHLPWRPDFARIRRLLELGIPAAGQIAFEGAVWAALTVLTGKLDEYSLAAHGITTQIIATTYMAPLGISSAAAVRVGQAVGRRDREGIARGGWTALLLSALIMGAAGIAMWAAPRVILRPFIADGAVVAIGVVLLRIAAFFE